jgi:acyl-coenzyme A synthetase/AMP-(fatty) acid ligase/3-hydroxymyristoyl/3-hydroxydecanoyl-(acyl carrier protein) dehydratase
MVFRLAVLQDKSIPGSLAEKKIASYCRIWTLIWCGFFVFNGGIAGYTVFFAPDAVWSVYNGGISYILMGILFFGEVMIRKVVKKTMPAAVPLSRFTPASRPSGTVVCYDGAYGEGRWKTWRDFLDDTAALRRAIRRDGSSRWILYCEDCWYFLAAFTALLQCGRTILLTANISPAYIAEIKTPGTAFLTDREAENARYIPPLLSGTAGDTGKAETEFPRFRAEDAEILMYTSGTTGQPKVVAQRLKELENDNAFILSKWGEEILSRKICSTVSQHHIYGLLFSIMLPFTAGVPFRRRKIQFPEEFERLTDESYLIVTVPAFLKRSVEIENAALPLKFPWIFTSGGALPFETAQKTAEIFGFWPVEIYGSTETSGIAWRRSKDGQEWTLFDNAHIGVNGEGCLVIRSPYIRDPAGFATGDMAEILPDGRFLLKGRADAVVKIEEKRVSLPEVESRLLLSPFVADVAVVALSGKRQYLAAAVALNDAGRERFRDTEQYLVDRYFREHLRQYFEGSLLPKRWRYPDVLPLDAQGKKKKPDIEALFRDAEEGPVLPQSVVCTGKPTGADGAAVAELFIPAESGYFDGHFPEFKLLPAVAQVELVLRTAAFFFGTPVVISQSKRIKFSNPILPDQTVRLELRYLREQGTLAFKITDPSGEKVYSAGTVIPGGAV